MFIDRAVVRVTAGTGGSGASSFARFKYKPKGGPDGGDGGRGGSIFVRGDANLATLLDYRYRTAWKADRNHGLDAIMLAPTRELVADLNQRARDHRLGGASPRHEVKLSDGNPASVGDVIITRTNDRRLRLSATDYVKNGDRWTITHISTYGDLDVRHNRSQLVVRLPADYVRASTGLGYATTIHSAQGVYRRHHARPAHRPGITTTALHQADPGRARQPPLPPGRRRRRPPYPHSS